MIKGTTPTHIFEVDFDTDLIQEIKITYSQHENVLVEKRTDDCEITEGKIVTKLTQEETFKFDNTKYAYVQIRILTKAGDCLATPVTMVSIDKCLDNEVIV